MLHPYDKEERPCRYAEGADIEIYDHINKSYVSITVKKMLGSGFFKTAYLADMNGEEVVFKDPHASSDASGFAECFLFFSEKGLPCPELIAADLSTGQTVCEKVTPLNYEEWDAQYPEMVLISDLASTIGVEAGYLVQHEEDGVKGAVVPAADSMFHTLVYQVTWDVKPENYGMTESGRIVVLDL